MKYDLIILTDKRYLLDVPGDPYKHNVFYEDDLISKAAKDVGLSVCRKAWNDASVDWSKAKAIIFRSTWDYFDRFEEFKIWLDQVESETRLINSSNLIHWNLDKHYLLELEDKGINIPKTVFIKKGDQSSLEEIHRQHGLGKTVLKPCVSGAGRHTYLLNETNRLQYEGLYKDLISQESMMIQSFQDNIVTQGEISIMLFSGTFTHAVMKKAKKGDFRVQDDFGGTVHNYQPTSNEIGFALKAVESCPELPVYARVDLFYDNNQQLALGELELIEPELWFRNYPKAATVLVDKLKKELK